MSFCGGKLLATENICPHKARRTVPYSTHISEKAATRRMLSFFSYCSRDLATRSLFYFILFYFFFIALRQLQVIPQIFYSTSQFTMHCFIVLSHPEHCRIVARLPPACLHPLSSLGQVTALDASTSEVKPSTPGEQAISEWSGTEHCRCSERTHIHSDCVNSVIRSSLWRYVSFAHKARACGACARP